MKTMVRPWLNMLLAAWAVYAVVGIAAPAMAANVVELTTSVSVADAESPDTLRSALRQAVDRIVAQEVDFEPALIGVVGAQVVGERIYVKLVVADDEAKAIIEGKNRENAPDPDAAQDSMI